MRKVMGGDCRSRPKAQRSSRTSMHARDRPAPRRCRHSRPRRARPPRGRAARRWHGDDQVRLREGAPGLAALLDHQPPLEHHVLADRQHAVAEHRPQLQLQPVVELGALVDVGHQLDAETDLREGDGADEQAFERQRARRRRPPGAQGAGAAVRTARWCRAGSRSSRSWRSRHSQLDAAHRRGFGSADRQLDVPCGEACSTSTSAWPVRAPCRRWKSSAAITTTSSRPWTVTCCGPSLWTRRTSSLKRALASCSGQWPGSEILVDTDQIICSSPILQESRPGTGKLSPRQNQQLPSRACHTAPFPSRSSRATSPTSPRRRKASTPSPTPSRSPTPARPVPR